MSMINETGESPAISSPGGNSPYSWILRIRSRVVASVFLPLVSCCLIVAWRFLYSEHQKELLHHVTVLILDDNRKFRRNSNVVDVHNSRPRRDSTGEAHV